MTINSGEFLLKHGYDFYQFIEKPIKPRYSDKTFKDIVPKLVEGEGWVKRIAGKKLYDHQYRAYMYLSKGCNIVLKSGTGSGKTEAWLLYTFKHNIPSLAVYPTLALANDQINRIKNYCRVLGLKVEQIDAKTKEVLWKNGLRTSDIRRRLGSANIVITNPAFLMMDLKRWAIDLRKSVLREFFRNVGLIVFDELDFYGPREIALLLAIISILQDICEKNFQIAVMTATLGNPRDLANYLSKVNSRKSIIIEGRPFKVKNIGYIVLGKNLRRIWSYTRRFREIFLRENVGNDVRKALEDYDVFKENVFKILEIARSIGIDVPKIEFDITELLQQYVFDEGLTIVFTNSIAMAEQFSRRIKNILDNSLRDSVAAHHHLISKSLREKIEEGARNGYIKIIFSPRTLSQGIDIGRVVRIVHLGLPEDVREFHQREGRKGRREEIAFTESIIIPFSKWDRELLSRGLDEFISWLKLPLEQVIVNEDNKYIMLFKSLFHFISSRHGKFKISDEEYRFLKNFGMVEGLDLSKRGKRTWLNLNFYEYSPPYGIKRIRIFGDSEKYLEDISHCDLVEKFQVGCFDYTSDSIVTGHRLGGKTGRIVVSVEEKPISYGLIWKHEALSEAYGEYEKIKSKWGERAALLSDYNMGRIYSEVLCTVKPPSSGFGLLYKFPSRVVWYIVSGKSRVVRTDGRTIAIRERRPIEVPTPTYGMYSDYTYGYTFELNSDEDVNWLRIGLAFLMVILRKKYGISLETIKYDVSKIGEMKLMNLHEPDAAGLLEKLDWGRVMKIVDKYEVEPVDEILLQAIDEMAHLDFIDYGLRWDLAKEYALRALNYLVLREKISLKIGDELVYVNKPSRALKVFSIDVLNLPIHGENEVSKYFIGIFDGEEYIVKSGVKEWHLVSKEKNEVEMKIIDLINRDFTPIVFNYNSLKNILSQLNLKHILISLEGLRSVNKFIDLYNISLKYFRSDQLSLETIGSAMNLMENVDLSGLKLYYDEFLSKIKGKPYSKWWRYSKLLDRYGEKYLKVRLKITYILYLYFKYKKLL